MFSLFGFVSGCLWLFKLCYILLSRLRLFKLFQVVFFVAQVVLTCFRLNQVVSSCTHDLGCCDCFAFQQKTYE